MKWYLKGCASLLGAIALVGTPGAHASPLVSPASTTATPTPMRWVVNMSNPAPRTAVSSRMLQTLESTLGVPVQMIRPLLQPNSYLVEMQRHPELGSLQTPQAIQAALQALPGVRFANPDIQLRRAAVPAPNDPVYAVNQASYMNTGAYASLRMQDVWEQTRGSSSVVIAVLDSGVLFENPELKGRLLPGYDFVSRVTPPTGTRESGTVFDSGSNDGDGRDPDPSDPGDAPPAGFSCPDSSTTSSDIIDAFYWATGSGRVDPSIGVNPNPANVINLSFATDTPLFGGGCAANDMIAQAIADARARNVSVVVSAGNNSGGAVQYPANCAGTIAAGAAEQDGQLATYTAKGAGTGFITLHAPGNSNGFYLGASNTGDSAPDSNGSTTFLFAGTSFSAPMVAGAISLLKAVRPSLTPAEIEALLRDNALPYPGNANFSQGAFGFTRSNTGVVRLANASVNERTFTPGGAAGLATLAPTPVAVSSGGGGGGGVLGLFGLIGLAALLQAHRRVSLSVYCKL